MSILVCILVFLFGVLVGYKRGDDVAKIAETISRRFRELFEVDPDL